MAPIHAPTAPAVAHMTRDEIAAMARAATTELAAALDALERAQWRAGAALTAARDAGVPEHQLTARSSAPRRGELDEARRFYRAHRGGPDRIRTRVQTAGFGW